MLEGTSNQESFIFCTFFARDNFRMNLNIAPKSFYISRHGESEYNTKGKIGGDSHLSEQGRMFASMLPDIMKAENGSRPVVVWTSTLKRTIETAAFLPYPKLEWKQLDELDSGSCDGLSNI